MKLSDKMPAQMNSTLAAKMPSTMESDAPAYAGEGGSDDAPVVPISRDSAQQDPQWDNLNEVGEKWNTTDKKTGKCGDWQACDRVETNVGGLPQRDPDNDGDLN